MYSSIVPPLLSFCTKFIYLESIRPGEPHGLQEMSNIAYTRFKVQTFPVCDP